MKTIESHVKSYVDVQVKTEIDAAEIRFDKKIDKSIDRAEARFNKRTEHYMKDLLNGFRQEIKMGFEAYSDRPTKEEVREIFREEMPALVRNELIAIMH